MNVKATQTAADGFHSLAEGVFASSPQELGFAPGMSVRSFLVRGENGNLLINASEGVLEDAAEIDRLGGATALWLGHGHEALTGAQAIADRFGVPVVVHEADREEAAAKVRVSQTFDGDREIADRLRAIPIPGHTPGSTAYLWRGSDARCLFTADSLYLKNGDLRGGLLAGSDRGAFLESLARLRDVEFDLLIPWVARNGEPAATRYAPEAFRSAIDAVAARIEAGGDG
jgi:glyoxylase-like metal-dependent hydrolase (beta-lactamase superfamily II)